MVNLPVAAPSVAAVLSVSFSRRIGDLDILWWGNLRARNEQSGQRQLISKGAWAASKEFLFV